MDLKNLEMRITQLEKKLGIGKPLSVGTNVIEDMEIILKGIPTPRTITPLNPWQFKFTYMVSMLLYYAYSRGYTVTLGDARTNRDCTGRCRTIRKTTSLHHDGLAIDLNLFRDGRWLKKTEDHLELGEFWESIGGSWGGRFGDGNHYSLEYNGRK